MSKKGNDELKRLGRYTGLHQIVTHRDKDGGSRYKLGIVEDAVSVRVRDYNHVIQKIKLTDKHAADWESKYMFRLCYFTLSHNTRKITWGQYNPVVYPWVFQALIRKAKKKGWLGLSKV